MRSFLRLGLFAALVGLAAGQTPAIGNCPVFPTDNIWNTRIDKLPVHPSSSSWVNTIGTSTHLHPDFGSGLYNGEPIGIPYVTVPGTQTKYPATFTYQSESDPGPYAIPLNAPIEGGSSSTGDRHVISVDIDNCILYEIYDAYPQASSWEGGSGAIFNLSSDALRPATWTSADAAGLPIFPGLVKYDEITAGQILHAIRFTAPQTQDTFVWPARHEASSLTGSQYPPMGARFRLKASFDISSFSATNQIILTALQRYGMLLADNGSSWYISGSPDSRWNNDDLHVLNGIDGSNFEAVDTSPLMVDPNSGQALQNVSVIDINPGSGNGSTQSFTFTFGDPNGYADLAVVDVLINNFLDGVGACYVAFAPASASSGYLYLVDDAGDGGYAGGSPISLPSSSTLGNSQCTISGAGSSVSASGNTLTLTLAITFSSGFGGNKVVYTAARSNTQNSGWQPMGTWNVPGTAPTGPAVQGVSPAQSSTTGQTYSFTFTDTNGYADLAVLDVLINNSLDGIAACYVAFVPTSATTGDLYLVDDAGDGGYASGSPIALPSSSTLQNSQCTINASGSSVTASGTTLTLNLAITFNPSFAGNQVFYVAARNNSAGNSGWQAVGLVTVP